MVGSSNDYLEGEGLGRPVKVRGVVAQVMGTDYHKIAKVLDKHKSSDLVIEIAIVGIVAMIPEWEVVDWLDADSAAKVRPTTVAYDS